MHEVLEAGTECFSRLTIALGSSEMTEFESIRNLNTSKRFSAEIVALIRRWSEVDLLVFLVAAAEGARCPAFLRL